MAAWFLPLLGGALAQGIGSLARGLMSDDDNYVQDKTDFYKALGLSPGRDPYGSEAEAAEARIAAITNPWINTAFADEDYANALQEGYIGDLMERATGARSLAGEESARMLPRQQADFASLANSEQGWGSLGAKARAERSQAAAAQNMILPTQAAMAAERNQAQDALMKVFEARRQQDLLGQDAQRRQRDLEDRRGLAGALAALRHYQLGGAEARARAGEEVALESSDAKAARR